MQEESIYHKPGPFVFTVRDKEGRPLYVGGTKNINQKVFKYAFEFADITGYYYDETFPDFWDEVDRKICELKPIYNTHLHSFKTIKAVLERAEGLFKKCGFCFPKQIKKEIKEELTGAQVYLFDGQVYYSGMDCDIVIMQTCEVYGIHYFKS